MNSNHDIAICGAGPVGLALALQLVRRGVQPASITPIDARPAEQAARDPRAIALSFGSRQILEESGCWPASASPIEHIHVSRRGRFGRTLIEASEFALPALGYVVRYGTLVSALQTAAERAGIKVMRPLHVSSVSEREDRVELRFAEGSSIEAAMLVQAEGGLYGEQDEKVIRRDYGQSAVVAQVWADQPRPATAFERFTDEGPLALLPLEDGYALVWSARPETASRLQALDEPRFLMELQDTFGTRVGKFTRVSPRHAYPLGLNAQPAATARTVSIGNASQTLHPVAGQGLNLGLRDAVVLAKTLAQRQDEEGLARFLALRRTDRSVTIRLTDALARLFANGSGGRQTILGLSLGLIDAVTPAKRLLAEHMMFGHR